ncbi:MAG: hypothetical protein EXR76_12275 [Myxococcales bacterium]|nr:hypothetical protein [Myxococcales bacterium]
MTHQNADWDPHTALPLPGDTWVLEASAGTGKTYQIATLVLRLVAESGIPIDRILAITFTDAATAELRDRVRRRLAEGRDALAQPLLKSEDAVLDALRQTDVEARHERVVRALRDFDLAGISTIHGFSQRMLKEFAFDSGEDSDIEVLGDTFEVRARLVDDTLARMWNQASPALVRALSDAKVDRKKMLKVAELMSAVVEPTCEPAGEQVVEPTCEPAGEQVVEPTCEQVVEPAGEQVVEPAGEQVVEPAGEQVVGPAGEQVVGPDTNDSAWVARAEALVASWAATAEAFAKDFEGDDAPGIVGFEALRSEAAASAAAKKDKAFNGVGIQAGRVSGWAKSVTDLAVARASPKSLLLNDHLGKVFPNTKNNWKRGDDALRLTDFWNVIERCRKHLEAASAFIDTFNPIADFARLVRGRLHAELVRRRVLTFDSMISRIADRITTTGGSDSALARRIRERYDTALVDEFQDTDQAQWTVLEAAFHGHARLLLIGDPKQAIYSFRGADLNVYLRARACGTRVFQMRENWRSDPRAVVAQNALWREGSLAFGQEGIDYVDVGAKETARLWPPQSGLQLRFLDGSADEAELPFGSPITKNAGIKLAAERAAAEIVSLLRGDVRLEDGKAQRRPLRPADFAILVNTHSEATDVRYALRCVGVPSVAASKGSIFTAPAALWLTRWLDAVAAGASDDRPARMAAVTPLFGWSYERLSRALDGAQARLDAFESGPAVAKVCADEGEVDVTAWTDLIAVFQRARSRWSKDGFVACLERTLTESSAMVRVLERPSGERDATDLRHLIEVLNEQARQLRGGPKALAVWLRTQSDGHDAGEGFKQRLESDADAVRIVTVHVSKGLEYPIVLLPFAWVGRNKACDDHPVLVRRPAAEGGSDRPSLIFGPRDAVTTAQGEVTAAERVEALRKAYVSLTRARHLTIAWVGPLGQDNRHLDGSAVHRLLFRDPEMPGFEGFERPVKHQTGSNKEQARLDALSKGSARLDALVTRSAAAAPDGPSPVSWSREPWLPDDVRYARYEEVDSSKQTFDLQPFPQGRRLRLDFVVTSFSGLKDASASPDVDEKLKATEGDAPTEETEVPDAAGEAQFGAPNLEEAFNSVAASELPGGGTEYGSFVHKVFEELDFVTRRAKNGDPLEDLVVRSAERFGFRKGTPLKKNPLVDRLLAHLPLVLETPLDITMDVGIIGPPLGFCLAQLKTTDRLDELDFDLRLGRGDALRGTGRRGTLSGLGQSAGETVDRDAGETVDRDAGETVDRDAGETVDRDAGETVDRDAVYAALLRRRETATGYTRAWLDHLAKRQRGGLALLGSVSGFLTGSIDLVFRADGRYWVADYKTNKIKAATAAHYSGDFMGWEMAHRGYNLQSLIYTVALHRHLKTRVKDYAYDQHFGGSLYLFVRGMLGALTPRDPKTGAALGVYADRWPAEVVEGFERALGLDAGGLL